jgi:hypothetical protein
MSKMYVYEDIAVVWTPLYTTRDRKMAAKGTSIIMMIKLRFQKYKGARSRMEGDWGVRYECHRLRRRSKARSLKLWSLCFDTLQIRPFEQNDRKWLSRGETESPPVPAVRELHLGLL